MLGLPKADLTSGTEDGRSEGCQGWVFRFCPDGIWAEREIRASEWSDKVPSRSDSRNQSEWAVGATPPHMREVNSNSTLLL